jgi:hypothetical protein
MSLVLSKSTLQSVNGPTYNFQFSVVSWNQASKFEIFLPVSSSHTSPRPSLPRSLHSSNSENINGSCPSGAKIHSFSYGGCFWYAACLHFAFWTHIKRVFSILLLPTESHEPESRLVPSTVVVQSFRNPFLQIVFLLIIGPQRTGFRRVRHRDSLQSGLHQDWPTPAMHAVVILFC